jgi:phosphoglycerol transferase
MEQNFMNEKVFGNLAGDLRQLTKEGEFYSGIPEIQGSNWTMAGIHTLMCGSPRLYNIRRNKLFSTVTVSELICFSDVLKIAGYNQFYLGGEFKTFSGKSFFLNLHGYDDVWGDKEIFKNYDIAEKDRWGWGAKDIDVFKIAKDKYIELSKQNKPFNLTFSTICAHAPEGIYDDRCKNSTNNPSLNAIECTNDGLKDFMDFIKQQPNYKDNLVVIVPDHLMMISKATNLLESVGKRSLIALFLNSGLVGKYDSKILYTDIAKMVLDKLNIENNAKFIMYNYKNEDVETRIDFLNKNTDKIQTFNQRTIMQN